MSNIVIFGGTGYAGSAIVREAVERGHEVVSVSRSVPGKKVAGVNYITGSVSDVSVREQAINGADVIVGALSPRGDVQGKLVGMYHDVATETATAGARFIVIGGFGSLRSAEGAPRFVERDDFPADYRAESQELATFLEELQTAASEGLDWLYVSPAATFGAFNPGEKTGNYRIGGEIALFDEKGESNLSGADLAVAIVDEIETPAHHEEHISIAY